MSDLLDSGIIDAEERTTVSPPDFSNSNIHLKGMAGMEGLSEEQTTFYYNIIKYFDTEPIELNRLTRYYNYWRMYEGKHWNEDEEEVDLPTPVFNKVKSIINKGISFLVGKPFTVHYVNSDIENILNPYIQYILRNSGGVKLFGLEMAQMGFVTGDCFLKPVYQKNKGVKLQVCNSRDVGVQYSYSDYDNNTPDVCQIKWKFTDFTLGKKTTKEHREIWTEDFKAVFIDRTYQPELSGPNMLSQVPLVHVRNFIVGKKTYGYSDVSDIESLNLLLNYCLRRFMNMVDYNADPITVLFGARIHELEKGDNKLWGNLPKDAKVQNLNQDSDFPSLQRFIEYVSSAIHEVASVTENSVQGLKHVSNTSGTAMYMNNLPLLELTDRKRAVYSLGLERALQLALDVILAVGEKMDAGEEYEVPPGLGEAKTKIKAILAEQEKYEDKLKPWNWLEVRFQDYMPKDRLTEMQMIKDEVSLGIESRKGAMKRLSKENIDEILLEVDKDLEFYSKQEMNSSGFGIDGLSGDITEGMSIGTKLTKNEKTGDASDSESEE